VVPKIVAVVAILAVFALYLYYTAERLDALHARVDAAGAALDAQLLRRSATAAAFAVAVALPPELAVAIATAASETSILRGLHHDREAAESDLSKLLGQVADAVPEVFDDPAPVTTEMHDVALRSAFARRFYNDTVRDALVVRDRRTVRWLRLAGTAPHPEYFEMDDEELPIARLAGVAERSPQPGSAVESTM
jgi:hypothetical protein